MSTPEGSQDVHDLIKSVPVKATPAVVGRLLCVLEAMNRRITQLDLDQIGMAGRIQELEERIDRLQSASGLGRPWNP